MGPNQVLILMFLSELGALKGKILASKIWWSAKPEKTAFLETLNWWYFGCRVVTQQVICLVSCLLWRKRDSFCKDKSFGTYETSYCGMTFINVCLNLHWFIYRYHLFMFLHRVTGKPEFTGHIALVKGADSCCLRFKPGKTEPCFGRPCPPIMTADTSLSEGGNLPTGK